MVWDCFTVRGDIRKLPFTHGIESEYFIVNEWGEIVEPKIQHLITKNIASNAGIILRNLIETSSLPRFALRKIKEFKVTDGKKKGNILQLTYSHTSNESITVDVIGKDPNLYNAQVSLLELVTPPCESLIELGWWTSFLLKLSLISINEMMKSSNNVYLMSFGAYPWQDKNNWITCGDHHHIGVSDINERIAIYNMLRNFVPHLIAITANSPFINGRPTDMGIMIKNGRFYPKRSIRSIRLKNNNKQLGPCTERYLPYLYEPDEEYFANYMKRPLEKARLVDLFPFSRYETIEVRFFDAQCTTFRKVSNAMLLQLIAKKASTMYKNGEIIPNIPSLDLYTLRTLVIENGLLGSFNRFSCLNEIYNDLSHINSAFCESYFKIINDDQHWNDRLCYAIKELIKFLSPEIFDLELESSLFTKYILRLLEYNNGNGFCPADIILKKYLEYNSDMKKIGKYLVDTTCNSIRLWKDPILSELDNDVIEKLYSELIRYTYI
ncbi:MAG: glutamate-cysteine ligase family protein [Candidatus Heimdallarchaeaceae archaeon]